MLIEVLLRDHIEEGRALLEALQREKLPVSGAFWARLPDAGYWQLVIASRLAKEKGPIAAYLELRRIWDTLKPRPQSIAFSDISILSPTSFNYVEYHTQLLHRIEPDPQNVALDNAYIYFLNRDAVPDLAKR